MKTQENMKTQVSQLDRVPRWVFGPTAHPVLQFVRDFVLHRLGYQKTLWSSAVNAYAVALSRRSNRGKMTDADLHQRLCRLEKWL